MPGSLRSECSRCSPGSAPPRARLRRPRRPSRSRSPSPCSARPSRPRRRAAPLHAGAPRVLIAFLPIATRARAAGRGRAAARLPADSRQARRARRVLARPEQRLAGQVRPDPGAARRHAGHAGVAVHLQPQAPAAAGVPSGRNGRRAARRLAGGRAARGRRAREAASRACWRSRCRAAPATRGCAGCPRARFDRRGRPRRAASARRRSGPRATSPIARSGSWHAAHSSSRVSRKAPPGTPRSTG